MKTEVRHAPTFATLFVLMTQGDSIIAEAGAMASMTPNLDIETDFNGGFFRGILRKLFGGETLFINTFTARDDGHVVLTQSTPGEIREIALQGTALCLQPGAFLACESGIKLGLGWAGFASWFAGEGLFRMMVHGHGRVWISAFGALYEQEINSEYVVDTGHLVAYEPTLTLSIGLAGGLFSSYFSQEGFVTRVRGRGKAWLQTRSFEGVAAWVDQIS